MSISQIVTNSIADSAVVTVDIADNAVTTAKIADGAITNAKIVNMAASKLTGLVPSANAPSGTILQVITRQLNGTTQGIPNTTNVQVQLSGWSQTITKLRADSRIVCFMNFYNYIDTSAGGGWWFLSCQVGSSPVSSSTTYGILSQNTQQFVFQQSAHQLYHGVWYDTRNQSTITYDFFHNSVGSRPMVWWNNPVDWVFFEVAS
jgi:hypothetical protein